MIEQAIYQHLIRQPGLAEHLTRYADLPAIFNQNAPADNDEGWESSTKYGRIVFDVDMSGDPERIMGGMLAVDIMCEESRQSPDEIWPVLNRLIHGYFFSKGKFVVAAQWKNTSYFTEPTNHVAGCTVTYDLLGFPVLSTFRPDVIARLNAWTSRIPGLHVINHDELPDEAWRPCGRETAVYWRLVTDNPAGWIPDTYSTIWRTATIRGHIFSEDNATAAAVARDLTLRLHAAKRLKKDGEAPIMVNRRNTVEMSADPLRTGQVTVEATYGVVVYFSPDEMLEHIDYKERSQQNGE